ncbi:MAG: maltose alpha-D-glucosyltransferase [SAR324 cluster bacterium]|nr:maltose alpha-D-glucosyltransferase [SAR324 cluster bacterium]
MSSNYWYKNAVFYELNIQGYQDSNNDGKGDFPGLTTRLDYIKALGVDCIWLLPMYPSPKRDDGYDIADYYNIHPDYGTLEDFKIFLDEAHKRGLRVIADLVLNHTSDQHPWFKEARKGPSSPYYDYYVWSDTSDKYNGVRIIFVDTEVSNWAWCSDCKMYYWHRFFSHQPDLNFDNPAVRDEMKNVLKFWMDLGLDGFRVDAVPYLLEREGSNCENLPETHAYLKELRAFVDANYTDKILLAEANQWPEDLLPYFGDGDEFQMAFHFPLMPRMFMALRQEHHGPIVDIIKRTPQIPENCQWAIFLRNHDELTLEMCTDEERDYMFSRYAKEPRMKCNIGIRRRLAPLLENHRLEMELLYSILFALPGAPVIYYGDEIGMGDNIYLGDRNSVRTPMQWNDNRNGGFSDCKPSLLYAPVIMDAEYSFMSVNVSNQINAAHSFLKWFKQAIHHRKNYTVFGEGTLNFIYPENKKILAFFREGSLHTMLCVFNLADSPQPVELFISQMAGYTPIEINYGVTFPQIGKLPYFLTLGRYGYYIFELRNERHLSNPD